MYLTEVQYHTMLVLGHATNCGDFVKPMVLKPLVALHRPAWKAKAVAART